MLVPCDDHLVVHADLGDGEEPDRVPSLGAWMVAPTVGWSLATVVDVVPGAVVLDADEPGRGGRSGRGRGRRRGVDGVQLRFEALAQHVLAVRLGDPRPPQLVGDEQEDQDPSAQKEAARARR